MQQERISLEMEIIIIEEAYWEGSESKFRRRRRQ